MCDLCNPGCPFAANIIIEAHSQAPLPRHPGTTPQAWELHLAEFIVHRRGDKRYITVRGVWPSVMKRYEGVGGCQMYGKKALRNT